LFGGSPLDSTAPSVGYHAGVVFSLATVHQSRSGTQRLRLFGRSREATK
jgi:hypothetical protein